MTIKEAAEFYNKEQEEIGKISKCIDELRNICWETQEYSRSINPMFPNCIPVPKDTFDQMIGHLKTYMDFRTVEFNKVIDGKED